MNNRLLSLKGPFCQRNSRAVLVMLLLIPCLCAGSGSATDYPFLYGLDLKGFEQKGPLLVYNKHNIFEYMNGEAENYLPRGFVLLYVYNFLAEGKDAELVLEIYDMGSQKGAEAIFSVYARPPGQALEGIGRGAWKSRSRFVFHSGPYFIRVTADPAAGPDFQPSPQDIENLAREADRALCK
jgi:uncharacterized protein DUF6599